MAAPNQLPQVLRPVYQQMVPVNRQPEPELLERRPAPSPEVEKDILNQVLQLSLDVDQNWVKERAGYGAEALVNFIFEHMDRIPLEVGATKQRIMNASMNSNDSFVQAKEDINEEELKERKIDALVVYIKQLGDPRERLPNNLNEYVKRRYPTIRCNVITKLRTLKNLKEVFAVCELIAMKALTREVVNELHLGQFFPRNVTPWLDCPSSIKARRKMAPMPVTPPFTEAHDDIRKILEAVGSNPPEVTCAVCYDDNSKKRSIACGDEEEDAEVHYVCHECIRGQARALCTDGQLAEGGQGFLCVDPDCKNVLPWANVRKVLDRDVRKVLSKRLDNEAILGIEGLESCKYCSFQMLIEASTEELKVFSCQKCRAEFCRACKCDWKDHAGRKCDEMQSVEDKKEAARKKLEEELAMAVMRTCHRCKVVFAKDDGCNKMTCRCGARQCYMCRAQDIDYNHFCPHMRDPNQPEVCSANCPAKCLLWVKTVDVDKAALDTVKEKARTDRELRDIVHELQ